MDSIQQKEYKWWTDNKMIAEDKIIFQYKISQNVYSFSFGHTGFKGHLYDNNRSGHWYFDVLKSK